MDPKTPRCNNEVAKENQSVLKIFLAKIASSSEIRKIVFLID